MFDNTKHFHNNRRLPLGEFIRGHAEHSALSIQPANVLG